jgi:YaiO family outer membrane protein
MNKIIYCIVTFLMLLPIQIFVNAQVNNDSLLSVASAMAANKKYDEAKLLVHKVVATDSSRSDALVLLANLNFWTGANDSALHWIEKANHLQANDDDFYTTFLNVLLVNKQYDRLLQIAVYAASDGYSDKFNWLQKQLIAYDHLMNYSKALQLYNAFTDESIKYHPAILAIVDRIADKFRSRSMLLTYSIDVFSNTNPQHLVGLGYNFHRQKNTYGLALNYANRFSKSDFQLETTNYLYLSDNRYVYANYGFGFNQSLFPRHRAGLEYYFPIKKILESSLGVRYLFYSGVTNSSVYIFTGHLGSYIGKGWLAFRPFWVINNDLQSLTLSLKYRKYGNRLRDFWGVELLAGNSPDDMYSISQSGFNSLRSYKIRFEKSWRINSYSDFIIAPAYSYEQVANGQHLNFRSRVELEFAYRF